jgi:hypothetical protein
MQIKADRYKSKLAKLPMDSSSSSDGEERRSRSVKKRVQIEVPSDSKSEDDDEYTTLKQGNGHQCESDASEYGHGDLNICDKRKH